MVENFPRITIITPVFNNVHFIESCILSILNQNYPNLEYIVIDGGSNDGTLEIIENYAEKLTLNKTHQLFLHPSILLTYGSCHQSLQTEDGLAKICLLD